MPTALVDLDLAAAPAVKPTTQSSCASMSATETGGTSFQRPSSSEASSLLTRAAASVPKNTQEAASLASLLAAFLRDPPLSQQQRTIEARGARPGSMAMGPCDCEDEGPRGAAVHQFLVQAGLYLSETFLGGGKTWRSNAGTCWRLEFVGVIERWSEAFLRGNAKVVVVRERRGEGKREENKQIVHLGNDLIHSVDNLLHGGTSPDSHASPPASSSPLELSTNLMIRVRMLLIWVEDGKDRRHDREATIPARMITDADFFELTDVYNCN